jgi:hypothetical protein
MWRNRASLRGCVTTLGVWLLLGSCALLMVLATGYVSGILPISAPALGLEPLADAHVELPADFFASIGGLATLASMLFLCATPALALLAGALAWRVFGTRDGSTRSL